MPVCEPDEVLSREKDWLITHSLWGWYIEHPGILLFCKSFTKSLTLKWSMFITVICTWVLSQNQCRTHGSIIFTHQSSAIKTDLWNAIAFTQRVSLFILCDKQGSYCHGHLHFQELSRQPSNRAEKPHIHIFLIHDHGFGLDHCPVHSPTLVSLVHGSLTPKGRGTHPGTVGEHMCFISSSSSSLVVL